MNSPRGQILAGVGLLLFAAAGAWVSEVLTSSISGGGSSTQLISVPAIGFGLLLIASGTYGFVRGKGPEAGAVAAGTDSDETRPERGAVSARAEVNQIVESPVEPAKTKRATRRSPIVVMNSVLGVGLVVALAAFGLRDYFSQKADKDARDAEAKLLCPFLESQRNEISKLLESEQHDISIVATRERINRSELRNASCEFGSGQRGVTLSYSNSFWSSNPDENTACTLTRCEWGQLGGNDMTGSFAVETAQARLSFNWYSGEDYESFETRYGQAFARLVESVARAMRNPKATLPFPPTEDDWQITDSKEWLQERLDVLASALCARRPELVAEVFTPNSTHLAEFRAAATRGGFCPAPKVVSTDNDLNNDLNLLFAVVRGWGPADETWSLEVRFDDGDLKLHNDAHGIRLPSGPATAERPTTTAVVSSAPACAPSAFYTPEPDSALHGYRCRGDLAAAHTATAMNGELYGGRGQDDAHIYQARGGKWVDVATSGGGVYLSFSELRHAGLDPDNTARVLELAVETSGDEKFLKVVDLGCNGPPQREPCQMVGPKPAPAPASVDRNDASAVGRAFIAAWITQDEPTLRQYGTEDAVQNARALRVKSGAVSCGPHGNPSQWQCDLVNGESTFYVVLERVNTAWVVTWAAQAHD